MTARSDELAARVADVRRTIADACRRAGRDPSTVTLVAVSKTWPTDDIAAVNDLGVTDFGENRVNELTAKAAELAGRTITWHFLGQIQSKKAAAVGRAADMVHSVDRDGVVPGIAAGARQRGAVTDVLIQVSLAEMAPGEGAQQRAGALPEEVAALADRIADEEGLRLAGVMTLPPRSVDPAAAFSRIAVIAAQLQLTYPAATVLSAGMSRDFVQAVAAGATHLRIGSAVFGERPPFR